MSDETNLADLLALNLHKFEDEVRNIVDKATKELSMEKTLKVGSRCTSVFACQTPPTLILSANKTCSTYCVQNIHVNCCYFIYYYCDYSGIGRDMGADGVRPQPPPDRWGQDDRGPQ